MNETEGIPVTCPHCRKHLRVKTELAGKRIRCPNKACAALIGVPGASERSEDLPELEPVSEPSRSLWLIAGASALVGIVLGLGLGFAFLGRPSGDGAKDRLAAAEFATKQSGDAAQVLQNRLIAAEERTREAYSTIEELRKRVAAAELKSETATAEVKGLQKQLTGVAVPVKEIVPNPMVQPIANAPEKPVEKQADKTQEKMPETPTTTGKIWKRAKAARLTFSLGNQLLGDAKVDVDGKLDEAHFPVQPFDLKKNQDHIAKAAEAVRQKNLRLARMRAVCDYEMALTFDTSVTLHVFADSEEAWPDSNGALPRIRVHGRRIFSMHMPAILESAAGIKAPYASDDVLNLAINDVATRLGAKDKEVQKDNYDLLLIGEKVENDGVVRGKVSGKLPDGSVIKDVRFLLTPLSADGTRLPPDKLGAGILIGPSQATLASRPNPRLELAR